MKFNHVPAEIVWEIARDVQLYLHSYIKTHVELSASIAGPEVFTTYMFTTQSCYRISRSPLSCHQYIFQGACDNYIPTQNACREEDSCV